MKHRQKRPQSKSKQDRLEPQVRSTGAARTTAGKWKRRGFRLLAFVAVPLVCFLASEMLLRFLGFGHPTSFLLPAESRGCSVFIQNNQFGWRFFGPERSRNPYPITIDRRKPPGTIRIFVFGESAAKGDPDPHFGMSRTLEAILRLRHPDTHFEVVNTAMTAINSHAILPIAQDCAKADGDIWVIYMGNNEVVGPFGAGTVFGSQSTLPLPLIRAGLQLKRTRTGQALESLLSRLQPAASDSNGWRGMEMFVEQRVSADDPRLELVYQHFGRNLADILQLGRRHHVGIVLSTVAVNLQDCAPFASTNHLHLNASQQEEWQAAFAAGCQAQSSGDLAAAAVQFQQAAKIDDSHAELRFRLARCALAAGKIDLAREHYLAARDHDTLRFRCDSKLNEIIRAQARVEAKHGVRLADSEQTLAQNSPNGIPGDNFFYEHVHLQLAGNYWIARTVAEEIENLLPENLRAESDTTPPWPSLTDCAQRLGWSEYWAWFDLKQIMPRLNRPPFTGQWDHETKFPEVEMKLKTLATATSASGLKKAIASCETALAAAPDDSALLLQLGQLKSVTGDYSDATTATKQALDLLPSDAEGWVQLGRLLMRDGTGPI